MLAILNAFFGIALFVLIAYLFSIDRKAVNWRIVGIGITLQIFFGLLFTQFSVIKQGFEIISAGFVTLLDFSRVGSEFLFGDLAKNSNTSPNAKHSLGVIVAFQVLPNIIFFATFSAALYYLGVLQKIVYGIAWLMARTMRLSGPESLSSAANIFMGQTEAPLLVKPFIPKMTRSELMCLMTGGMATIAGSVMAAYVAFLGGDDQVERTRFATHLLTASIMNAPAAVVMAKILFPEKEYDKINPKLEVNKEQLGVNLIDAMSIGARDGLFLALNVGAMLIAFVAVIAMLNFVLNSLGDLAGINALIASSTDGTFKALSLEYLFGQVFRIIAFAMGVSWDQTLLMGSLLGQKTAINEFVAYSDLARLKAEGVLEPKTLLIATYALCGFSNFSSIAIQIGGIGVMAPNQQTMLSRLGLRALLAASMACMMTGTIAGAINSL